jgi:hypothetical protein
MMTDIKLRLLKSQCEEAEVNKIRNKKIEVPGIDPSNSRVLIVSSNLCDNLTTRSEESYRVCVCVYVLAFAFVCVCVFACLIVRHLKPQNMAPQALVWLLYQR